MIDALLLVAALAVLAVGAGTDIKWREVPDWVNFAGIAAGLGVRGIASALLLDWSFFVHGIAGLVAMFVLAWLLYYFGQWGGGDSKLLMALGAMLGLEVSWENPLLAFLVWAVLVGGAYGLLWSIALAVKYRKAVVPGMQKMLRTLRVYRLMVWALAALFVLAAFLLKDSVAVWLVVVLALIFPLLFYSTVLVKAIEQCCMLQWIPPERLVEGDWIAKDVVVKGKRIVGPRDLGVSKKQILQLEKLNVKKVLVKQGIPFVPALLIAYVLALWFGNVVRGFF